MQAGQGVRASCHGNKTAADCVYRAGAWHGRHANESSRMASADASAMNAPTSLAWSRSFTKAATSSWCRCDKEQGNNRSRKAVSKPTDNQDDTGMHAGRQARLQAVASCLVQV